MSQPLSLSARPKGSADFAGSGSGLDYFGLKEAVGALQEQPCSGGLERCEQLSALAWYLRQRDTATAVALMHEARCLLATLRKSTRAHALLSRLTLVEAESLWLAGDFAAARDCAMAAQRAFDQQDDPVGAGDAMLSQHLVAVDEGASELAAATLHAAVERFERGGDRPRALLAKVRLAQWNIMLSPRDITPLDALSIGDDDLHHPGLAAAVGFVRSWHLSTGADNHSGAIRTWLEVYEKSLEAGIERQAMAAACNIAVAYNNLGDNATALAWGERAIAAARNKGWPIPLGGALSQTAQILREVGNLEAARNLLAEAMQVLRPFTDARNYAVTCPYFGHLLLETGDAAQALHWFCEAETRAQRLGYHDLMLHGLRGQAEALSRLGRMDEALAVAERALGAPPQRRNAVHEIETLRVLAGIARRHKLPAQADVDAPSSPIHYLERALQVGAGMQDYQPPHTLHAELSSDYEAAGDLSQALEHQRLACQALVAERTRRAADLATAMQIRYETEKAHADAEHHRVLAESETQRSQALQDSLNTLEHLASIGHEITINLDAEAVFAAIHRHVGALLDAPFIAIFLLEEAQLVLRYGVEHGSPLPTLEIDTEDPHSWAARSLRENRLLSLELSAAEAVAVVVVVPIPGTCRMPSALYAPLAVHDKALGVLSIQSDREHAYGEREHRILRTLAAYAAVALANVHGAQQLASAQAELEREKVRSLLVHTGKLATIGRLASGVIHELSHPVGALGLQIEALDSMLNGQDPTQAAPLLPEIVHELARLRRLIQRLRNMARSDPPRIGPVHLPDVLGDARRMYGPRLASEGISCDEDVAPLSVQADAELLSLAIANIVSNAADAMKASRWRHIAIRAWAEPPWALMTIRDSGPGLPDEVLQNLFKPFFTTKPAGSGLGLGLTLSAEYLSAMQARIAATNLPEGGAEFRIALRL